MVLKEETGLLYERIADQIAHMIGQGSFRPGDRIPSVRQTCAQSGVSTATVVQAYLTLENRGLIEARPKSGFFVRAQWQGRIPEPSYAKTRDAVCSIKSQSLIGKIFEAAGRPDIVPFGAACPSPEILPAEKLSRMLRAMDRRHSRKALMYDMPPGCEALRHEISKRSLTWGSSIRPDEIITTVGAMEALNLSLRAVAKPGDVIAIESPNYFGVLQGISDLGMRVVEIPTHPRDGMDVDALARAIERHKIAACLAMPNFNNPLGCCMPDSHKRRLVELLGNHDIPLIEDDIYGDLHHGEQRPRTAQSFDTKGLVLLCSSFTKTLAPGFRVGWVAPGRYYEKVLQLKYTSTVATPTLMQLAIAEFLKNGGYERYLRGVRRIYAESIQRFSQAVAQQFPEGTTLSRPKGGFVLWIGLPKGCDSIELHDEALARKISITPGTLFSATGGFRQFIRINCAHQWSRQIERALTTLGELAKAMVHKAGSASARPRQVLVAMD